MARSRRMFRFLLVVGAVFVAASLMWWWLAVPALVKYPTDVDVTPRYEGTFRLFVNPETAAPLAQPQELPLTIDRRIQAIADESSSSRVVVKETMQQKAGTLLSVTEENQYVFDRRTMQNVDDPRAYAYSPEHVVDRSGAYRLQLPMGTDRDEVYEIYKNEIGRTYKLVADSADPTRVNEGLTLSNFKAAGDRIELTSAYLAALNEITPLPTQMTWEQLKPQLAAAGIDFDKTLAGVLAAMTPEDRALLAQAMAAPVKLRYVTSFEGNVAVDPETGTEVNVVRIEETIGALPVIDNAGQLTALLGKYGTVPAVQTALPVLTKLMASVMPLFRFEYAQTEASVAAVAAEAKEMRGQIRLAERWLPGALLGLGLAVLLFSGAVRMRLGRISVPVPAPQQPKHA